MTSLTTSWVLDANLDVWAFLPGPGRDRAAALLAQADRIVVPSLWVYEVTSVLHAIFRLRPTPEEIFTAALDDLLRLPDEVVSPDVALARAAYAWADRLGQRKAYDAFYLALAERLGAEFWTGDQRLYRRARQVGANFVRLLRAED